MTPLEVKGAPITALVDSGSTHTFVDPEVIKKACFAVFKTNPMVITVANGEKMHCDTKCRRSGCFRNIGKKKARAFVRNMA